MKRVYFLFLLSSLNTNGQTLSSWKNIIMNGYFTRTMKLEVINPDADENAKQILKNEIQGQSAQTAIPQNKERKNYLRFLDIEPLLLENKKDSIFVGTVFMSQTYFDNDFNRLFNDSSKIKENENGFFMIYKLFESSENKIVINLYPDLNNFCSKKIHKQFLNKKETCKSYVDHYNKMKTVAQKPDYDIEEIWEANSKKSMIFNKFIKSFQCIPSICGEYVLSLTFTKFAQSSDKKFDVTYDYTFKKWE